MDDKNNLPQSWNKSDEDIDKIESSPWGETFTSNDETSEIAPISIPSISKKTKTMMGIGVVIFALLIAFVGGMLAFGMFGNGGEFAKNSSNAGNGSETFETTENGQTSNETFNESNTESSKTISDIDWFVQPELEYYKVFICDICCFVEAETNNGEYVAINPRTGLTTFDDHPGHCGDFNKFVYDPERNLFGYPGYSSEKHYLIGMYPLNEWPWWEAESSYRLITVEIVDSSLREKLDWGEPHWWQLRNNAYSGKFALMYNGKFLTDFIYNDISHDTAFFGCVAMRKDDKWGILDNNADELVPFIFEHIALGHDYTSGNLIVFAKYNDKYGIIRLDNFQYNQSKYSSNSYRVTESVLNIRSEPDENSERVGRLQQGTHISIFEKTVTDRVWGRIAGGWVAMEFVESW